VNEKLPCVAAAALLATLVSLAAPEAAGAQAATCRAYVLQAQDWISSPDRYMEAPRLGDPAHEEPALVYAEIDGYEPADPQTTVDGLVLRQTIVPVYRSLSLGGILQRIAAARVPRSQRPAALAAVDAIVGSWDAWANGDATQPVPYEIARAILVDAEGRCTAA
jgi:hypothetical protein